VVQVQVLLRAGDPLYELALPLGGHRKEDRFWQHTLGTRREPTAMLGATAMLGGPGAGCICQVLYDAKRHSHTAQGLALSAVHGDLLWLDGGWPGSCHEHELIELSGVGELLDAATVVSLLDLN
jgi:hypothetical protein